MQLEDPLPTLSYATRGIKRGRDWSITIAKWVGVWVIGADCVWAIAWFGRDTLVKGTSTNFVVALIIYSPLASVLLVLLAFVLLGVHHFAVNFWGRGGKYSHWLPSRRQMRVCLLLFVGLTLSCGAALLIGQAMADFARAVRGDESAHEEETDTSATEPNSNSPPSTPITRSSSSDLLRKESLEFLPVHGSHFNPPKPLDWR